MTQRIISDMAASITELKTNPMQVVASAGGRALAILNRNKPEFYCVPAKLYEQMMDALEDAKLAALVRARADEPRIAVTLDDL